MAIIPDHYLSSVVSIGVRTSVSTIAWIGTGFFVGKSTGQDNKVYPLLVSNKHVYDGKDNIVLRMKKRDNDDLQVLDAPLKNDDGSLRYITHDLDDIDVAVLPLSAQFIEDNGLDFPCFNIDENALSSNELRTNGADEGTIVYMLGFPMGLVNISSNLPICRMGCISRMSETQISEQHNMLVDIQNFPGNSGSPIITRPEFVSITGTPSLTRSVLIGIVHSYIQYREQLINSQTKEVVEIRSENSGIALVHPVEFIREIIDKIYPKPNIAAVPSLQTQPALLVESEA